MVALDPVARAFDQLAVMHARGARGLASAASEAQIEMAHRVGIELEPALRERLHQIDTATRRIHLGARQRIGRARLEAEPAMHAIEEQLVIDDVANRRDARELSAISIPPTKHPGLKIPAGSKLALSRRINLSAPSSGESKAISCSSRRSAERRIENAQMAASARGDRAPSGHAVRAASAPAVSNRNLRDAASGVSAKLRVAFGETSRELAREARRCCAVKLPAGKLEVAQPLIGFRSRRRLRGSQPASDRRALQNLRRCWSADSSHFRLISREPASSRNLPRVPNARARLRTQHFEMRQRERVEQLRGRVEGCPRSDRIARSPARRVPVVGRTLNAASVTIPSVPKDPVSTFIRS